MTQAAEEASPLVSILTQAIFCRSHVGSRHGGSNHCSRSHFGSSHTHSSIGHLHSTLTDTLLNSHWRQEFATGAPLSCHPLLAYTNRSWHRYIAQQPLRQVVCTRMHLLSYTITIWCLQLPGWVDILQILLWSMQSQPLFAKTIWYTLQMHSPDNKLPFMEFLESMESIYPW